MAGKIKGKMGGKMIGRISGKMGGSGNTSQLVESGVTVQKGINNPHRSRPGGGGNPGDRGSDLQKQKADERQIAPQPAMIPSN